MYNTHTIHTHTYFLIIQPNYVFLLTYLKILLLFIENVLYTCVCFNRIKYFSKCHFFPSTILTFFEIQILFLFQ